MRNPALLALTLLTAPLLACGGEKPVEDKPAVQAEAAKPAESAPAESPSAKPAQNEDEAPEAAVEPAGDYLEIVANHEPKKPSDPATMRITGIKVVEADFDPKKLEGASATFELDFNTLSSAKPDRDDHLKSDDFLDVAQFPTATVEVTNVKAVDAGYTANATVTAKGMTAKWLLTFEAVDITDRSVRIKGEHKFGRSLFKIGKPGNQAEELTARWDITLERG